MKIEISIGEMARHGDADAQYARLRALGYDSADEDLSKVSRPRYQDRDLLARHCAEKREAAEKYG
ncbi:MAG: hypothetical protein IKX85_06115, partial [Clostridia bacterium]|nr:hypothetical protein [Clostridia bacterium]